MSGDVIKFWNLVGKGRKKQLLLQKNTGTDTIKEGLVFYLGGPVEIAGTVDHETGSVSYGIAIVPDEVTVAEDNDSQKKYWQDIRTYQKSCTFAAELTS